MRSFCFVLILGISAAAAENAAEHELKPCSRNSQCSLPEVCIKSRGHCGLINYAPAPNAAAATAATGGESDDACDEPEPEPEKQPDKTPEKTPEKTPDKTADPPAEDPKKKTSDPPTSDPPTGGDPSQPDPTGGEPDPETDPETEQPDPGTEEPDPTEDPETDHQPHTNPPKTTKPGTQHPNTQNPPTRPNPRPGGGRRRCRDRLHRECPNKAFLCGMTEYSRLMRRHCFNTCHCIRRSRRG